MTANKETGTIVSQTIDVKEKKIWTFAAFSKGHHARIPTLPGRLPTLMTYAGKPRNLSRPQDDPFGPVARAGQDRYSD